MNNGIFHFIIAFIYFWQCCCFLCIVCTIIKFVRWLSFKIHNRVAHSVVRNREKKKKKQCRLFFHYIHAPFNQDEAIFIFIAIELRFCMKIEWTFWTEWSNLPNGALSKQHISLTKESHTNGKDEIANNSCISLCCVEY